MIVRERENEFIMIKQNDHAHISGDCFGNWKPEYFKGDAWKDSVHYAITNHDFGWQAADAAPFWNDAEKAPYDFMNFPMAPKLVFYKDGIDKLENLDAYAGKLASRHYLHLTSGDTTTEDARNFVKLEQARQDRLEKEISGYDRAMFELHYAMLSVCDNLSLYACLNEPGIMKENEYPLFQNGIPVPEPLQGIIGTDRFEICWTDDEHIQVTPFPLQSETTVTLRQRTVSKKAIQEHGLMKSFQTAPVEEIKISFIPEAYKHRS